MASHQLNLLDSVPSAESKHRRINVPRSSVEAYQRTHAHSRMAIVANWLELFVANWRKHPTSAELSDFANGSLGCMSYEMHLLYVRRGLSDALANGLVEHAGKRKCMVAGTLAVTWKVCSR